MLLMVADGFATATDFCRTIAAVALPDTRQSLRRGGNFLEELW